MPVLQTVNLKKYYQQGETVTKALDGVSLEINGGEFVSIVGTSGSGKSTLLHMMGGLDSPTSGSVIINGEDISQKSAEQLTVFRRRHIGFIFQNYNLVPVLNVYENIVLPVQLDGKKVDKKLMDEIVEVLGLQDKLENLPNNLSGGQQQRVSIARALVGRPSVILADEPTGALDSRTGREVLSMLQDLHNQGHTVVLITHDNSIAVQAQRIIRLEDGRVVYDGPAGAPEAVVTPRAAGTRGGEDR